MTRTEAFITSRKSLTRLVVVLTFLLALVIPLHAVPAIAQSVEPIFDFELGVSDQDADFVFEGIRLAYDFFTGEIGASFDHELQVHVNAGYDAQFPDLIAYWDGESIVVYTGSPVWLDSTPAERTATIVHEFTHVYQTMMLGWTDETSPAWFEEGIAEYLSYYILSELGILDHSDVLVMDTLYLITFPPARSLSALASWETFQQSDADVYDLSHVGVARLLENAPLASVGLYYRMLSSGMPLENAFALAFGVTPAEHYANVDSWLDTWISPADAPPDDLVGRPIERASPVTLTQIPVSIAAGDQFLIQAETLPAVVCMLEIVPATVEAPLIERTTFADGDGDLFWLVTIPSGSGTGLVTIEANCGGETETRAAILG